MTWKVRNGVALLDARGPADWALAVDADRLNIRHVRWCVLGQVYGHYDRGKRRLRLKCGDAARCGFIIGPFDWRTTRAWRQEILKRQHAHFVTTIVVTRTQQEAARLILDRAARGIPSEHTPALHHGIPIAEARVLTSV